MTTLSIHIGAWLSGVHAVPVPYTLQGDPWVAGIVLACFFLSAWVLACSRGFLWQRGKDFLLHRDRPDIFSTSAGNGLHYQLLLLGQTCILAGACLFVCCRTLQPLPPVSSSWKWIGTYVAVAAAAFFAKWLAYLFFGWIFLDKDKTSAWTGSYATLLFYLGFALFLLKIILIAGAVLFLFLKILTLYKWIKLFCDNLYGCFFVILYFCALEIIPCLLLYRGLEQLNNHLIVKY